MLKLDRIKAFLSRRLRIARHLFGAKGRGAGLSGYASATSVLQGNTISFHVSSLRASAVRISIVRIGAVAVPVHTASATVGTHAMPARAYEVGCNWPSCYTLSVPTTWPSGLYQADLVNAIGDHSLRLGIICSCGGMRFLALKVRPFPSTCPPETQYMGCGAEISHAARLDSDQCRQVSRHGSWAFRPLLTRSQPPIELRGARAQQTTSKPAWQSAIVLLIVLPENSKWDVFPEQTSPPCSYQTMQS